MGGQEIVTPPAKYQVGESQSLGGLLSMDIYLCNSKSNQPSSSSGQGNTLSFRHICQSHIIDLISILIIPSPVPGQSNSASKTLFPSSVVDRWYQDCPRTRTHFRYTLREDDYGNIVHCRKLLKGIDQVLKDGEFAIGQLGSSRFAGSWCCLEISRECITD